MEVGYWCAYGAFTTFAVSYVLERGMGSELIGFMASAYTLCAFLGQLFWGSLCDRIHSHKKLFLPGCLLLMTACCLFYAFPMGVSGILLYGLVGFVQQPIGSVLDTWVVKSYLSEPYRFSRARAASTFAYAILMPVQGHLIRTFGYGMMLIGAGAFLALALGFCLFTADAPVVERAKAKAPFRLEALAPLVSILAILFCMGAANAPQIQMTAVLVASVGGTVVQQSYVMAANSIAMSGVLLINKRLQQRFTAWQRLMAASAVFVLTLVGISLARQSWQLVLCYLLNGAGSALYLPAMRQLMLETAPENLQATAQGLGDAFYSSLAGMCSTAVSGVVIAAHGTRTMVLICLCVQTFAFAALLLRNRLRRT